MSCVLHPPPKASKLQLCTAHVYGLGMIESSPSMPSCQRLSLTLHSNSSRKSRAAKAIVEGWDKLWVVINIPLMRSLGDFQGRFRRMEVVIRTRKGLGEQTIEE